MHFQNLYTIFFCHLAIFIILSTYSFGFLFNCHRNGDGEKERWDDTEKRPLKDWGHYVGDTGTILWRDEENTKSDIETHLSYKQSADSKFTDPWGLPKNTAFPPEKYSIHRIYFPTNFEKNPQ